MVESTWENQDTMAYVEMNCSVPTCNMGPGGTPWKTPPLPPAVAVQCQSNHLQDNHGAQGGSRGLMAEIKGVELART